MADKLNIQSEELQNNYSFIDMDRIYLNRRRQRYGIESLKSIIDECNRGKIKPVMASASVSGLFVIFQDSEFFRIKNIPDTSEAHQMISRLGLVLNESVESVRAQATMSLAQSDTQSNVV